MTRNLNATCSNCVYHCGDRCRSSSDFHAVEDDNWCGEHPEFDRRAAPYLEPYVDSALEEERPTFALKGTGGSLVAGNCPHCMEWIPVGGRCKNQH